MNSGFTLRTRERQDSAIGRITISKSVFDHFSRYCHSWSMLDKQNATGCCMAGVMRCEDEQREEEEH